MTLHDNQEKPSGIPAHLSSVPWRASPIPKVWLGSIKRAILLNMHARVYMFRLRTDSQAYLKELLKIGMFLRQNVFNKLIRPQIPPVASPNDKHNGDSFKPPLAIPERKAISLSSAPQGTKAVSLSASDSAAGALFEMLRCALLCEAGSSVSHLLSLSISPIIWFSRVLWSRSFFTSPSRHGMSFLMLRSCCRCERGRNAWCSRSSCAPRERGRLPSGWGWGWGWG
jgi:hypothetical protein